MIRILKRKPCPNCGGEAVPDLSGDLLSIRAKCSGCGIATGFYSMWWLASDAWNDDKIEDEQTKLF